MNTNHSEDNHEYESQCTNSIDFAITPSHTIISALNTEVNQNTNSEPIYTWYFLVFVAISVVCATDA